MTLSVDPGTLVGLQGMMPVDEPVGVEVEVSTVAEMEWIGVVELVDVVGQELAAEVEIVGRLVVGVLVRRKWVVTLEQEHVGWVFQ